MNRKKRARKARIKSKIKGTKERPRLSVFRSIHYIYAQLIDDESGKTILGLSEKTLSKEIKGSRIDRSKELGLILAKKANEKKIKKVVFDKGNYAYHGRIKSLAEGAREGGLIF